MMGLDREYLRSVFSTLGRWHIDIAAGLGEREIAGVEAAYGFTFPPDLRQFLRYRMPISNGWVNWRTITKSEVKEWLDRPANGICFDVEHNNFWLPEWGIKPENVQEAKELARAEIARAPVMIPINGHRFIPAEPCEEGNPIFSIYQTDIIYYGYDLAGYLSTEFKVDPAVLPDHVMPSPPQTATTPRSIRFWDKLIAYNEG